MVLVGSSPTLGFVLERVMGRYTTCCGQRGVSWGLKAATVCLVASFLDPPTHGTVTGTIQRERGPKGIMMIFGCRIILVLKIITSQLGRGLIVSQHNIQLTNGAQRCHSRQSLIPWPLRTHPPSFLLPSPTGQPNEKNLTPPPSFLIPVPPATG